MNRQWEQLKKMAADLKQELKALQVALAENLVPWYVKAMIIFTIAYALSPIDLIPDFIPVLGLLDDLILLPLLIYLILKFIPDNVMEYCRKQALTRKFNRKSNYVAGAVVVLIWLIVLVWLLEQLFPGLMSF